MADILLNDVKKYLRITHEVDDNYITELIDFAKDYIKEQTGVDFVTFDKTYRMAIYQVVAHFYDKRESVSDKANVIVPYTMNALIQHIGMRGEADE